MYYSSKDIPYLCTLKFDLDPIGKCNFDDLLIFHQKYIAPDDYPFWEWFNDHINTVIDILR